MSISIQFLLILIFLTILPTSSKKSTPTQPQHTTNLISKALTALESGDSSTALKDLLSFDPETLKNSQQLQLILAVAAVDQNQFQLAINASSAAIRLSKGASSVLAAARPVLGAALLNMGKYKAAARELNKCLTGKLGMTADMGTVRHFARAHGASKNHKLASREIAKYCKNRFSLKNKQRDKNPNNKYQCYEILGKQYSLARNQLKANQAYEKALSSKSKSFRKLFQGKESRKKTGDIDVLSKLLQITNKEISLGEAVTEYVSNDRDRSIKKENGKKTNILVDTPDFVLFTIDNFLNQKEIELLKNGMARSKSIAFQKNKDLQKQLDPLVCIANTHPLRSLLMNEISKTLPSHEIPPPTFTEDGKICSNYTHLPLVVQQKLSYSSSTFVTNPKDYTWLDEKLENVLPFLNPKYSYPTQLLEYNSGSDYSRHVDCNYELDANDRAFTILIYLESPTSSGDSGGSGGSGNSGNSGSGYGGETVFPRIRRGKVSVEPVPGRLVGFTSINSNGYCNYKSEHYSNQVSTNLFLQKKSVVQKWYSRKKRPKNQKFNVKKLLDGKVLNGDQTYVSCDGSGSCREFIEYVSIEEEKERQSGINLVGANVEL